MKKWQLKSYQSTVSYEGKLCYSDVDGQSTAEGCITAEQDGKLFIPEDEK